MTPDVKQQLGMFFSGAMAWHALTHGVLAGTKTDEPHKSLGITMTPGRNALAAALWAGVSVALARYAFTRHGQLAAARAA